jgi:hypothetical protein
MAKVSRTKNFINFVTVAIRDQRGNLWIVGSNLPDDHVLAINEKNTTSIRKLFMQAELIQSRMPKTANSGLFVFCHHASTKSPEFSKTLVFQKSKLVELWQGGFPQAKGSLRMANKVIEQFKLQGITKWHTSDNIQCLDDQKVFQELGFSSLEDVDEEKEAKAESNPEPTDTAEATA